MQELNGITFRIRIASILAMNGTEKEAKRCLR